MSCVFEISNNILEDVIDTSLTTYIIPQDVTRIADGEITKYAFQKLKNKEFRISFEQNSRCETIGSYSFHSCSFLTDIDFTNATKLSYIGQYVFVNCKSLKTITFPRSLTTIDQFAFWECISLVSVTFKNDSLLETMNEGVFAGCSIPIFTIPQNFKPNDFTGTVIARNPIEEFKVHKNNKYFKVFNKSLFSYNLTILYSHQRFSSLSIPKETNSFARSAFAGYTFPLIIPHQITKLHNNAFYNYQGTSITLYSDFNTIQTNAFARASCLVEIKFFGLINEIQADAFLECNRLRRILFSILPKSISPDAFPKGQISKICFYGEINGIENILGYRAKICSIDDASCFSKPKSPINQLTFFTLILLSSFK